MSTVIDSLERTQLRRVPQFDAGDRLRVHFQVVEGTRRRSCIAPATTRYHKPPHGVGDAFTRHAPASELRAQHATM